MKRPRLACYFEAMLSLAGARLNVLYRPARDHFARRVKGSPATAEERSMVARCVTAAARRLPLRTQCYEQALAARSMLARRGRSSQLHFGSGRDGGKLTAHVWLTSGDAFVIGEDAAERHVPLASSPD